MPADTSLEVILWDAIAALVSAIDGRNHSTGHSMRVATYAVQIAEALGWSGQRVEQIRLGALLHDIGQICWPETLLKEQDRPLNEAELKVIESHTYKGVDFIQDWPLIHFVKPYILYHQEWVDGSGYPFGIQGECIPPEVQIVSLADVYEALRHPRSYKQRLAYSHEETLRIMSRMRGKRWSADLFDRFSDIASNWQLD
jgi:putative nucleotidyltransferase with HDIG domain